MPKNIQDEFYGQQEREHDDTYDVKKVMPYGWNAIGAVPLAVDASGALRAEDLALRWEIAGSYIYLGEAVPGSVSSGSVWRVQRVTVSSGKIEYADGDANFDNVWDDRASLSYS